MSISVPDGMMKAVVATYANRRGAYSEKATRADLEAALRWLDRKLNHMEQGFWPSNDSAEIARTRVEGFKYAIAEVRRMFLAPERPPISEWTKHLSGYTFTQEEADAIKDYVQTAVGRVRAGFNGEPTLSNPEYFDALKVVTSAPHRIMEAEVLEEIKDLILPDIESGFFKPEVSNQRLIEAYRRGLKARTGEKQ